MKHGQTAFDGWDVPTLFRYVFFHVVTRTVFCVRSQGAIAAVAFAWGESEKEIRRRADEGTPFFAWQKSRDKEDAIFVGHVVTKRSSARGQVSGELPALLRQALKRWPDFARKSVFTWRDGKLHELTPAVLKKMLRTAGE